MSSAKPAGSVGKTRALSPRMICRSTMARWSRSFERSKLDASHVHRNADGVLAAAQDDAFQGARVAEIATPGERDVLVGRDDAIGGIEIDEAEIRTVHTNPRVGSVAAREPRL